MNLKLTSSAILHLKSALNRSDKASAIRLGVTTSGCSGYAYVLEYALGSTDEDLQLDFDGLCIFIDPLSKPLLEGTEIDLKVEGVNRTLSFNNPNVVSECGCGESFAVGASVSL